MKLEMNINCNFEWVNKENDRVYFMCVFFFDSFLFLIGVVFVKLIFVVDVLDVSKEKMFVGFVFDLSVKVFLKYMEMVDDIIRM